MEKSKKAKNSVKKVEWVDFTLKINYIYNKLFKNNKEKLIFHFTQPSTKESERKSKQKTINNWLSGKSQKPNKFNLDQFQISKFIMSDGSTLFNLEAFTTWSIERFRQRVDEYIVQQQQNSTLEERMRYIYYFDLDHETLAYYELNFTSPNELTLNSSQLANNMLYRGEMIEFQSMLYITVQNQFDYMQFIFENFATVFSQEVRVFGTAQCKDYFSRKPKAYIVLLTSTLLGKKEEKCYLHKLNRSNLLMVKPFSRLAKKDKTHLIENFVEKVEALAQDIEPYKEQESLYTQLALQSFRSYEHIAKKVSNGGNYFIRNTKSLKLLIFNALALKENIEAKEVPKVEILYALTRSNIALLELDNPHFSELMREQIRLVDEKLLQIDYLFVVTDMELITDELLNRLLDLSKHLLVKIVQSNRLYYKEIIYPHQNFIIYQTQNEMGSYLHITKGSKDKMDIERTYRLLLHEAISLDDFMEENYPLNGQWHFYSFGSKIDAQYYYDVKVKINNDKVVATFPSGVHCAMVQSFQDYTLLLFDNAIIKIQNINLRESIHRIIIIGKELNMTNRDVLLFGIMSREELKKEEVLFLLKALYKQEEMKFRLRVDDDFDAILGEFVTKRE